MPRRLYRIVLAVLLVAAAWAAPSSALVYGSSGGVTRTTQVSVKVMP